MWPINEDRKCSSSTKGQPGVKFRIQLDDRKSFKWRWCRYSMCCPTIGEEGSRKCAEHWKGLQVIRRAHESLWPARHKDSRRQPLFAAWWRASWSAITMKSSKSSVLRVSQCTIYSYILILMWKLVIVFISTNSLTHWAGTFSFIVLLFSTCISMW